MTDDVDPVRGSRLQDRRYLVFEFPSASDESPVPINICVVHAEVMGLQESPNIPKVVEFVLLVVIVDLKEVVGEHVKTCYSMSEDDRIG